MVQSALIAAVYVAVTLAVAPIAFGPVQFRISEALAVLPCFTPAAVPGLFVGCLLANSLAGSIVPDVVFGSLATLIGALASYGLRKHKFLVCVPPILSNVLIVPWVLHYGYGYPDAIPWLMLTVGIGEVLAVGGRDSAGDVDAVLLRERPRAGGAAQCRRLPGREAGSV